jgi:hypothetical protein
MLYMDVDVYNAILKVSPPEAKLCVPDNNSTGNENGTIFAIFYFLLVIYNLMMDQI